MSAAPLPLLNSNLMALAPTIESSQALMALNKAALLEPRYLARSATHANLLLWTTEQHINRENSRLVELRLLQSAKPAPPDAPSPQQLEEAIDYTRWRLWALEKQVQTCVDTLESLRVEEGKLKARVAAAEAGVARLGGRSAIVTVLGEPAKRTLAAIDEYRAKHRSLSDFYL